MRPDFRGCLREAGTPPEPLQKVACATRSCWGVVLGLARWRFRGLKRGRRFLRLSEKLARPVGGLPGGFARSVADSGVGKGVPISEVVSETGTASRRAASRSSRHSGRLPPKSSSRVFSALGGLVARVFANRPTSKETRCTAQPPACPCCCRVRRSVEGMLAAEEAFTSSSIGSCCPWSRSTGTFSAVGAGDELQRVVREEATR
jgi:hypothetical protein